MADVYKKISDFNVASSFGDNDLLLVSQTGITKVIRGSTLKELAIAAGVEAAKINNATVNAAGHLILHTTSGANIDAGKVTGNDGVSVTGATIDSQYHLILSFSDGTTKDAGYCRGASGAGTGDMLSSDYDADHAIKGAGGIAAYTIPKALDIVLSTGGWSNKQQTVSSSFFLKAGYKYIVAPTWGNADAYSKSKIKAKDVTVDGSMTFVCDTVPTTNLSVQVLRVRVQ